MSLHKHKTVIVAAVLTLIVLLVYGIRLGESPVPENDTDGSTAPVATSRDTLTVLDAAERSFDNRPALALVFSAPLSTTTSYDRALLVSDGQGQPVKGRWVFGDSDHVLFFPFVEPNKTYRIAVQGGMKSAQGAALQSDASYTITTRQITPSVGFASRGAVLPAKLTDGLPIVSVNVPEVDLEFLRAKPDKVALILNRLYRGRDWAWYELDRMHEWFDSVYLGRFKTGAEPNVRTTTHIPVEQLAELKSLGLYIAVLREPGRFGSNQQTSFFFVTDIGLQLRRYRSGSSEFYAASLSSGKPVLGVKIELFDDQGRSLEKLTTDKEGTVRSGQPSEGVRVAIAEHEQHVSFLNLGEPELDLSEFDVGGSLQDPVTIYAYGDRDLYRPGETAYLSVLLRDVDGAPLPAQPLAASLRRPDAREVANFTLLPETLGYYQRALALPADAQTGRWRVELRADPAQKTPTAQWSFNVEEFLPERLKVDFPHSIESQLFDKTLSFSIASEYLYGAPAAGNRLGLAVNMSRDEHPVKALPEFYFGDVMDDKLTRREELPERVMDDQGRAAVQVMTLGERPGSPMAVRLTASVFESGGRPVSRSTQRTLWPAPALVGVRPRFSGEFADARSSAEFDVVMAGLDGVQLAVAGLQVRLVREEREFFWTFREGRGWGYDHSDSEYPVYTQELSLAAGERGLLRLPVEWGRYRLEITDPTSGLVNRYRFRAGWDWGEPGADSARPDRVQIKLDKPSYRGGDTARVKIVPPHAGEGWVLVESDRLLWRKAIHVPAEGLDVAIPVDPQWQRHDIYISALVLRPGDAKDKVTPNRALGVVHLPLERSERRVALTVSAPDKVLPNTNLEVGLTLEGVRDAEATVTVSAVDMGILNITNYASPDPFAYFFAKRAYGVQTYDLYGKVIENLAGVQAKLRFGGDADAAALRSSKRGDAKVQTVALFSGPVAVDGQGRARVSLPIPDFNGTLRLMAVAFTADRFGAAQRELRVAAPIVAEIAMPRFLAAGDESLVSVDLHNLSGKAQTFTARLTAEGAAAVDGLPTESITLQDGAKTTLRALLRASASLGEGNLRLSLAGDEMTLSRQWTLPVRPAYPGERRVVHHRLDPRAQWTLDAQQARGLQDDTVDIQLLVSSVPPVDVRNAVKGLLNYPYGCLEQTTSAATPWLYLDDASAAELGLPATPVEKRNAALSNAITRVSGMQLPSGGFALWDTSQGEEIWLTPYVTEFLLKAQSLGYEVPSAVLEQALSNLRQRIEAGGPLWSPQLSSESSAHTQFAAAAYAAYVLAQQQRAPLGSLRTLFEQQRRHARSGLPLVHLGIALTLQGDATLGQQAVEEGVGRQRDDRDYLADYGSDVRDTALVLALLERHKLAPPGADQLLFRLADELRDRVYLSTQERLAVFLAGYQLSRSAQQPWRAAVQVGGQALALGDGGSRQHSLGVVQLREGAVLDNQSDIPLYASLDVAGYPQAAPAPINQPIALVRTWRDLDGRAIGERPLRSGELLLGHVRIDSDRNVEHALLVDLLPAGLELENLNITQGERLADLTINGVALREALASPRIRHQEFRDDRYVAAVQLSGFESVDLFYLLRVVSPGVFRVPPPVLEDMYRPDLRAIGFAPENVIVSNPE